MFSSAKAEKIHEILKEVFPNDVIPDDIGDLKMGDLASWDSLGNFNLILAIETEFDIRFSMEQISVVKSIAQFIYALEVNND